MGTFDPDEIVTLFGRGQMTLRTAVTRVMAGYKPWNPLDITIFRDGQPSILDLHQIEILAAEWEIDPA